MPSSPTPAQSAASVANGARSHGPVTEAGKAASAGNAVRHGLAGRRITLDEHEAAKLEALLADYTARRRPVGALEEAAVAAMALALLKLARADAMEAMVCDAIAGKEAAAWPTLGTVLRYRARITREHRDAALELDRLQRARGTAAARDVAAQPRTNEPDRRAAVTVSEPRREAVEAPPPVAPPALNRHERRRLEALQRKAA